MNMTPPPFKLALAALFLNKHPLSLNDVMRMMHHEYVGLGFFEPTYVSGCLQNLKAIGILRLADQAGHAELCYELTPYGAQKVQQSLRR